MFYWNRDRPNVWFYLQEANVHAEARGELERKLKELEKRSKYGKEELQEQV